MNNSPQNYIDNLKRDISNIISLSNDIAIFVVANIKDVTENPNDYDEFSIVTEFFTQNEFEEIINAYRKHNIYIDTSTDEIEFIEKVIAEKPGKLRHKYKIVYNSAQKGTGPGRKSLIPAFCNMNDLPILGSNAYVRALCRNKYHTYSLLKNHNVQNLNAWQYDSNFGWLTGEPINRTKVIIKPIYESASIGIDNSSIIVIDENSEQIIKEKSIVFKQPVIVQEFICGYEVEVPVICDKNNIYSLGTVGIAIKGEDFLCEEILTYDIVYNDDYSFYDYKHSEIEKLKKCAEECCKILGIEGLGRIDFRITKEGQYYITDVSTNPHIIEHSSCAFIFKQLGLEYSKLPLAMLAVGAKKYGWI